MEKEIVSPNISDPAERPLVFMGGVGYDEQRNRRVAGEIIVAANGYDSVISIPDETPMGPKDGTVVYVHPDGNERELPGKLALKQINDLPSDRFTRLHDRRATELVKAIESSGNEPVDAIFQSVDVSTGILAMHKRPDLFRKVVLLDPSSIISLPSRWQYLKEEWKSGNLRAFISKKNKSANVDRFEESAGIFDKYGRLKRSNQNGNKVATYVSAQASMLHSVAQSEQAPEVSIVASRYDHAYSPVRLLQALVSLDDVATFFITNTRHGLAGKKEKLDQLLSVLESAPDKTADFLDRLHFAGDIAEDYRHRISEAISLRRKSN